ncbi:MAG: acetyltransferase [Aquisalinus sp.]|nr:acetyltransferase [Aquisalinus sp.]
MDDIPLLERWEEAPHMVEAMPDFEWDYAEDFQHDPDWRDQLIAEVDGVPIGFLQILDAHREETRYWGEVPIGTHAIDIWIGAPDYLGKGYGWQMMTYAITKCFAVPACQQILIDPFESNAHAISFYKKLGFEFVESRLFDEEDEPCSVYRLTRKKWSETNPAE